MRAPIVYNGEAALKLNQVAPQRFMSSSVPMRSTRRPCFLLLLLTFTALLLPWAHAQDGPLPEANDHVLTPAHPQAPAQQPPAPIERTDVPTPVAYDPAIFERPLDPALLAGLRSFDGAPTAELFRDKQFRRLMKDFVPNCMFHYGRDMPLADALDMALSNSRTPVTVLENRYVLLSGNGGPYLSGRALVWVDTKDGLGLGAFYFTPTNGEPTPTVAVFSRQVKEPTLALSQLPPAFNQALAQWSMRAGVASITTRYFLTGTNKRILLEHDEDFCALGDGTVAPPDSGCEQLNADAADTDETAAYYLEQVHYATNATAWMIGPDQVAWVQLRDRTCLGIADPLGCRIRVTREHTHVILHRPPPRPVLRR